MSVSPADLGFPVQVDRQARMAYYPVRHLGYGESVYRTDMTHEAAGVLVDYDQAGRVVGVETFIGADGKLHEDTARVAGQVLAAERETANAPAVTLSTKSPASGAYRP